MMFSVSWVLFSRKDSSASNTTNMSPDPQLQKYRAYQKHKFGLKESFGTKTVAEANDFPLLFEAGDSWDYSVGVDWAGEMVSRVNGNITLEAYLEQNVWGPLGMKSMTFHPATTRAVMDKLVDMSQRDCAITVCEYIFPFF
jgi:CubicO group peptidase (beta-lactamase class C family)